MRFKVTKLGPLPTRCVSFDVAYLGPIIARRVSEGTRIAPRSRVGL
jgi:hypothetical protein